MSITMVNCRHSQSGFSWLADKLFALSSYWCSFCCNCSTFCNHFRIFTEVAVAVCVDEVFPAMLT